MSSNEYIGDRLLIFTAFFVPLQIIVVALRYYARWLAKVSWAMDDSIVLFALCLQLIMAGISIGSVKQAGVGYHEAYLKETNPEILVVWGKYLAAISTLYFFVANIPKLAILVLYHRLFPGRKIRMIIYVLASIIIGASFSNTVAALAACKPYAANWDPTIPGARCINKEALFIYSSVPNIVTDIAMLILPLPIIWKLNTNKRMKVGLTITFMVGSFGLVTSILRFDSFFHTNSFTDGTYAAVELISWTQTEPGVYLISSCLPTYRPLIERIGLGKLKAVVTGGNNNTAASSNEKKKKNSTGTVSSSLSDPTSHKLWNFSKRKESDDDDTLIYTGDYQRHGITQITSTGGGNGDGKLDNYSISSRGDDTITTATSTSDMKREEEKEKEEEGKNRIMVRTDVRVERRDYDSDFV